MEWRVDGDFRQAGTFEKDLEGGVVFLQAEKTGGATQGLAPEEWKMSSLGLEFTKQSFITKLAI